ncbi:hypothetical protein B0H34DRAFT_109777 [Crassisporium funariophilum]|nr:hypothetical protein B0H34DRAFT_109777 [Crassisporium funariophilum]
MRVFNVGSMFGIFGSSSSSGSGSKATRAKSEPPRAMDEDVEMAPPTKGGLQRCQSMWDVAPPAEYQRAFEFERFDTNTVMEGRTSTSDTITTTTIEPPPRAPSPADTDVYDPESQDIVEQIQTRGIKVRDFAFPPPPSTTDTTTTTPLPPTLEMFDQYRALAEVEYRWSQPTRIYPISGKSLSHLLDIGWITPTELAARIHPMDLLELATYCSRAEYPWKAFRWSVVPGVAERKDMVRARWREFVHADTMRRRGDGLCE